MDRTEVRGLFLVYSVSFCLRLIKELKSDEDLVLKLNVCINKIIGHNFRKSHTKESNKGI